MGAIATMRRESKPQYPAFEGTKRRDAAGYAGPFRFKLRACYGFEGG